MTNHEKRELIFTGLDKNSKWYEAHEIVSLLINTDEKRLHFKTKINLIKEALPLLNQAIENLDYRANGLISPFFRAILFELLEDKII